MQDSEDSTTRFGFSKKPQLRTINLKSAFVQNFSEELIDVAVSSSGVFVALDTSSPNGQTASPSSSSFSASSQSIEFFAFKDL